MKTIIILALAVFGFALQSAASSKFKIDEALLELAFDQSEDMSLELLAPLNTNPFLSSASWDRPENIQMIAAIVAIAEWITGVGILIPIHRIVLGCGEKTVKVVALYCVTLGGCGLLPPLDALFLLLDKTDQKFVGSEKFLMWAGKDS